MGQGISNSFKTIPNKDSFMRFIKDKTVNIIVLQPDNCKYCLKNETFLNDYCSRNNVKRVFVLKNINISAFLKKMDLSYLKLFAGNYIFTDPNWNVDLPSFISNRYLIVQKDTLRYDGSCNNFEEKDTVFFSKLYKERCLFSKTYLHMESNHSYEDIKMHNEMKLKWEVPDTSLPISFFIKSRYVPNTRKLFVYKVYENSFIKVYEPGKPEKPAIILDASKLISASMERQIYEKIYYQTPEQIDSALKLKAYITNFGFKDIDINAIWFDSKGYYVFCGYKPVMILPDSQYSTQSRNLILYVDYSNKVREFWFEKLADFSEQGRYINAMNTDIVGQKKNFYVKEAPNPSNPARYFLKIALNGRHEIIFKSSCFPISIPDSLLKGYNLFISMTSFAIEKGKSTIFSLDAVPYLFSTTSGVLQAKELHKDWQRTFGLSYDTSPPKIITTRLFKRKLYMIVIKNQEFYVMIYNLKGLAFSKGVRLPKIAGYVPADLGKDFVVYLSTPDNDAQGIKYFEY